MEIAFTCELPSGIVFVAESEANHPFGMCDGAQSLNPGVFTSGWSPELPGSLLGQWSVSLKLHHSPASPCSHFCFSYVFPRLWVSRTSYMLAPTAE